MTVKVWAADAFAAEACRAYLAGFAEVEVVAALAQAQGPLLVCVTRPEELDGHDLSEVTGRVALVEIDVQDDWENTRGLLLCGLQCVALDIS